MIRLTPDRSDQVSAAIREVTRRAQEAERAPDTEAARQALAATRDAILDAAELINDVEREATRDALAKIGEAA